MAKAPKEKVLISTQRHKVLKGLRQGLSKNQIANDVGMAVDTVRDHMRELARLGLTGWTEGPNGVKLRWVAPSTKYRVVEYTVFPGTEVQQVRERPPANGRTVISDTKDKILRALGEGKDAEAIANELFITMAAVRAHIKWLTDNGLTGLRRWVAKPSTYVVIAYTK